MSNIFENLPQPLPFDRLIEDVAQAVSAFAALSVRANTELEKLVNEAAANFLANSKGISCAEALNRFDKITRELTAIVGVVSHLESVCTSDAVRQANEKLQELSAEFSSALYANPVLYQFFAALKPEPEDARSHANLIFAFESSGAKLAPAERARFIEIEQKLSDTTTRFSQAVVDSTKEFSWHVSDASALPGVLASDVESARDAAISAGVEGYKFSLQAPSYRAIMSFHSQAPVREKFARAFGRRASDGAHDNSARVSEILKLRAEKAALLGYPSFADLMVADRMAKKADNITAFFDSMRKPVLESAARDLTALTNFARASDKLAAPQVLSAWDVPFYMQRFEESELGLDPQVVREYFPFEPTLSRIFGLLESVFGVSFKPVDLPVWWQGVQSFSANGCEASAVNGQARQFGSLYTDYYARDNKRAGAWMDMLAPGITGVQRGIGFMAGNFSKPTAERPALLTHEEITTLFHEAGHLLHGLVCETKRAVDGMQNVAWDFIEVPSQLLENWAWEPVVLKLIGRHYKTGLAMPDDLIAKIVKSRSLMNGLFYARHLGNSNLDLALHTSYSEERDGSPVEFARGFLKKFVPFILDDSAPLNAFSHLFDAPEGYAGGYYSYLWSEALEADIYSAFAGVNVLNRDVGARFVREVLMPGDTQDAGVLFKKFMGRGPSPDALLRRITVTAE